MSTTTTPTVTSVEDVRNHLETRGWGKFFNKVWTFCGLGWLFDAMDNSALGLTMPLILAAFALSPVQGGLIASITSIGAVVGALGSGILADRVGRRTMIIVNMLIYSIGSLLVAISPSYETLLIARALQGIGLGGEFPMLTTYINEVAPRRYTSRLTGLTTGFLGIGYVASALIGIFIVPLWGFRGLFFALFVPAILVAFIRKGLPESPVYLAKRGRLADASAVLDRIDRESTVYTGDQVVTYEAGVERGSIKAVIWPVIFVSITWFLQQMANYGYNTWVATAVSKEISDTVGAFGVTAIIFTGMLVGYGLGAWIGDKMKIYWFVLIAFLAYGIALTSFGFAPNVVALVILGWFSSVGFGFAGVALNTWTPRNFPANVRGTAVGIATSVGRVGAIVGPTIVALVIGADGDLGPGFVLIGVSVLVGVLLIVIVGWKDLSRGFRATSESPSSI